LVRAIRGAGRGRPGDRPLVRGGRRPGRSWEEKLAAYRGLVDDYYEADRFREFCDQHLAHADEYIDSPQFDAHLVETIRRAFPPVGGIFRRPCGLFIAVHRMRRTAMLHPFMTAELVRGRRAELEAEATVLRHRRRPVRSHHDRSEIRFPRRRFSPRITMKRA
jgi:hypothetical protein